MRLLFSGAPTIFHSFRSGFSAAAVHLHLYRSASVCLLHLQLSVFLAAHFFFADLEAAVKHTTSPFRLRVWPHSAAVCVCVPFAKASRMKKSTPRRRTQITVFSCAANDDD